MKLVSPIKWTGSKRILAPQIIKYFPKEIDNYYEPFCGSAAMLFSLLQSDIKINKYFISDINKDLINLLLFIQHQPNYIYMHYKALRAFLVELENEKDRIKYYNNIRRAFNHCKEKPYFLFLLRACYNGLIRYNSRNEFNTAFHINRLPIHEDKLNIFKISELLNKNNVIIEHKNFEDVKPLPQDLIFLDPPYATTKKSTMYNQNIDQETFFKYVSNLNCKAIICYDGKRYNNNSIIVDNSCNLLESKDFKKIELKKANSSFNRLKNKNIEVSEMIYVK